jgi:hypothetical protein
VEKTLRVSKFDTKVADIVVQVPFLPLLFSPTNSPSFHQFNYALNITRLLPAPLTPQAAPPQILLFRLLLPLPVPLHIRTLPQKLLPLRIATLIDTPALHPYEFCHRVPPGGCYTWLFQSLLQRTTESVGELFLTITTARVRLRICIIQMKPKVKSMQSRPVRTAVTVLSTTPSRERVLQYNSGVATAFPW